MSLRPELAYAWISIHASVAVTSAAVGMIAGARSAHADSAAALFDRANRLLEDGKVAEACEAFEAANRAEPGAGTLIYLGACREKNHQLASAWSAYREALARAKDPLKRDTAAAALTALQPRLSYLTVTVSERSRAAGLTLTRNGTPFDSTSWNRPLPVDGGDYVLVGHARGRQDREITAHVEAEAAHVSIDFPELAETSHPGGASTPHAAEPTASSSLTLRRRLAIGLAAASAASLVPGITFGIAARRNENKASDLCPNHNSCGQAMEANAAMQAARSDARDANVAFGIAAAAAIGAGVLWFVGAPVLQDDLRMSLVPSVAPQEVGLAVRGSF
jgi:serine/threonine-protein kinase